jgi:hypothetical protein
VWEPSHGVGSGRLHGGECGWERRVNANTERGAGGPIHRRSCCTGNYKGALCSHPLHNSHPSEAGWHKHPDTAWDLEETYM